MTTSVVTVALPVALGVIMFGLGLTLTVRDFAHVTTVPKAALITLACQIVILPAIGLVLALAFRLPPALAVGVLLLAASPGGTTASMFSHLAGGDVALNVTLTAVNSVLSVITIPLVVGLSITGFLGGTAHIGPQPGAVTELVAVVLIPVVIGMLVRSRFPGFADRMARPVKIASAMILVLVTLLAIAGNAAVLAAHAVSIGSVALLLSVASLTLGYWIPKLARVERRQAIASTYEIGIHNVTLAITIGLSVLGSTEIAVPAAIYGIVMYLPAAVTLFVLNKAGRTAPALA